LSRLEVRQLEPDEARARTGELAALLREAVDAGMALGQLAPVDTERAFAQMVGALEPGERLLFGAFVDEELVGTAQLERARPANSRHRAEVTRVVVRGDAQRQGVGRELMRALEAAAAAQGITLLWLDARPHARLRVLRAARLRAPRRDAGVLAPAERRALAERFLFTRCSTLDIANLLWKHSGYAIHARSRGGSHDG
jgi:ribosomal protein S18 acetylase RimI-like enzyme